MESWDSWGQEQSGFDGQAHSLGHYENRSQNNHVNSSEGKGDLQEDVDFFSDMTPQFKKATKVG